MAIQMTRAEYEAKYGTKPVFDTFDTSPAPLRMTAAEYKSLYKEDPFTQRPAGVFGPLKETVSGIGTQFGGGEHGIARKLVADVSEASKDIQGAVEKVGTARSRGVSLLGSVKESIGGITKGIIKGGGRVAGDIAGAVFAPIGAAIGATGFGRATESFGEWYVEKFAHDLTENPIFQKFSMEHPNAGEDFDRATLLLLGAFDKGKIQPSTVVERTKTQIQTTKGGIANKLQTQFLNREVTGVEKELQKIEDTYVDTRKANSFSKYPVAESRARIARSNVLDGSVDKNGLIRTKQPGGAVEQYKKAIDGGEGVVRTSLQKEGRVVNSEEVRVVLEKKVYESGLEGADLITALNGVKREIAGLRRRANEFGDIPLDKVHDAKINTTNNINYNTPPESATYRKAVARGYKEIVEAKSELPIKDINKELGKYLDDIARLERLDGKRVKGGKLGKYTAQITGNIAGGAVGGMFGGLSGAALGTIIGGEVGAMLRGRTMAGTFKGKDGQIPQSAILEKAKAEAAKPKERNLKAPDPKVGAPKDVPKTKEVSALEKKIADNVEAQKKAIKAQDYTLVAKLKEAYDTLVTKLKELIKRIRETPNKEGGFIRLKSSSESKSNKPQSLESKKPSSEDSIIESPKSKGAKSPSSTNLTRVRPKAELGTIKADLILNAKRDVPVRDLAGNKLTVRQGEPIAVMALKDNKYLLKSDTKQITVNKSTYENLKSQSLTSEAKEFAPELRGLGESVKGQGGQWKGNNLYDANGDVVATLSKNSDGTYSYTSDFSEGTQKFKTKIEAQEAAVLDTVGDVYGKSATKFEQYTLPEGKNYKEVLIKAPEVTNERLSFDKWLKDNNIPPRETWDTGQRNNIQKAYQEYEDSFMRSNNFKSSHWDEPNVISHLRLNERTYQGKKVTFMEELQSDWAREGRSKGFAESVALEWKKQPSGDLTTTAKDGRKITITKEGSKFYVYKEGWRLGQTQPTIEGAKRTAQNYVGNGVPSHPLVQGNKWIEPTIKRALQEAVGSNSKYFSWINGKQTSARYNLATHVEKVDWYLPGVAKTGNRKTVNIKAKEGVNKRIEFELDKNGVIKTIEDGTPTEWQGKKLDEVLGKGLADKIMEKPSGTLSGDGLSFGGEWANNLYDKQVGSIVKQLTGQEVKTLDLGLPVDKSTPLKVWKSGSAPRDMVASDIKVGNKVYKGNTDSPYIITDILGDGKFKAVPKSVYDEPVPKGSKVSAEEYRGRYTETFDISTKTTTQQGIEITPRVKALIKGEAPPLKTPKGVDLSKLGAIPSLPLLLLMLNDNQ